jgi:hypothetical protein
MRAFGSFVFTLGPSMRRGLPCYESEVRGALRCLALALVLTPLHMNSQVPPSPVFFEVPNNLMTVEGNAASQLPFGYIGPVRYQQVYDASQFSQLPLGGAFLGRIFFRADCASQRSWLVTNLQVSLSITAKKPRELSEVFAENTGMDETVVLASTHWSPPASGTCPGSFFNGNELNLDVPFWYDPSRGNLLVDIRNHGIDYDAHPGPLWESLLDAQDTPDDAVSRVAAFSLTSPTAEVIDSVGLVTAFEFFPPPVLTVEYLSSHIVLTWRTQPQTFRLQWADSVGTDGAWSDYPGPITENALFRQLTLMTGLLHDPKFFRLFWDTPQPLAALPLLPALQVDPVKSP